MKQLGVVVARFQVPFLHAGHVHLLNHAWQNSDKLVVVLGTPSVPNTRNILSYQLRVEMVRDYYPFATFREILDHHEDKYWSRSLDEIIQGILRLIDENEYRATLYGSRDCFAKHYDGAYRVVKVAELKDFSGTKIRDDLVPVNNAFYRMGLIKGFNLANDAFNSNQTRGKVE